MGTTPSINTAPLTTSFEAQKSARNKLIFDLTINDNTKKPIKIGDGTYGSVFRCQGDDMDYAVKIFYESTGAAGTSQSGNQGDTSSQLNYEKELKASNLITTELKRKQEERYKSKLVLPEAYTTSFKSSPAFQLLKTSFPTHSFSDYALVMPLYECSLKEWLEQGRPLNDTTRTQPAYHALTHFERDWREHIALWIVREVAQGVLALHLSDYHHHDLKPGNVLLCSDGEKLRVALADLGFLATRAIQGGTISPTMHGTPSGGTRHYRSPEQRDHFDVCDAAVEIHGSSCVLRIRDPKFAADTLTEVGDLVVFSKHSSLQRHPISRVMHGKANRSKANSAAVPPPPPSSGLVASNQPKSSPDAGSSQKVPAQKSILSPAHVPGPGESLIWLEGEFDPSFADERTQIIIQKRHTIRTDLFGLGALLYDLITGGRSPERFYDRIRRWDREDQGDRLIANLCQNFKQRVGHQDAISPEFNQVFDLLKHKEKGIYPSETTIMILLSLMLSRAPDSYFMGGQKDAVKILHKVISDLEEHSLQPKDDQGKDIQNLQDKLWKDDTKRKDESTRKHDGDLIVTIKQIQAQKSLAKRLHGGYYLLYHIYNNFLARYARGESIYYTIVSPEVNFGYEIDRRDAFEMKDFKFRYSSKDDFLKALIEEALPILPRSTDLFIPPYLNHLTREAFVTLAVSRPEHVIDNNNMAPLEGTLSVEYSSNQPLWSGISKGDVIVINFHGSPPRLVLSVTAVESENNQPVIKFKTEYGRDKHIQITNEITQQQPAMILKPIDPKEYYLAAFAMFIHQILFVDSQADTGLAPPSYYLAEQALAAKLIDQKAIQEWYQYVEQPSKRGPGVISRKANAVKGVVKGVGLETQYLQLAFECMADLYLLLATRFFDGTADGKTADRDAMVRNYLRQTGDYIFLAVGKEHGLVNQEQLISAEPLWLREAAKANSQPGTAGTAGTAAVQTQQALPQLEYLLRTGTLKDLMLRLRT